MREIKIDGRDLACNDPMRKVIEMMIDIRINREYVSPLEIFFENGEPVKGKKSGNLRFK